MGSPGEPQRVPQPLEKLAVSLNALRLLQASGRQVFRSSELSRVNRERLVRNGFLQEVIKGWLISAASGERIGKAAWFQAFWEFCDRYSTERFGSRWHLSPEQSLLLHAGNTAVPRQVVVCSPKGTNNSVELLHGTSIYDLKQAAMPPTEDIEELDGLGVLTIDAALTRVRAGFFQRHPIEAKVILEQSGDAGDLLRKLLAGGHPAAAGRLAGAFRHIGKEKIANEILSTMKAADFSVREVDPFSR